MRPCKFFLKIFKRVRKRLIKLHLENRRLKVQLNYYKSVVESYNKTKH